MRAADTNAPASTPPAGQPGPGMRGGPNLDPLNLTADQKPKVQAIMEAQRQKIRDLRQDTSLSPEDRKTKMKAIHDDTASQMKAVLTPEQFIKWQKMASGAMREHRMGRPPGGENANGTNAPAAAPQK